MFKLYKIIRDNVRRYKILNNKLVYVSFQLFAQQSDLVCIDLIENIKTQKRFDLILMELTKINNEVAVSNTRGRKSVIFSTDNFEYSEFDYSVISSNPPSLLITVMKGTKSKLALYDLETKKIKWQLDFSSRMTFLGVNDFFCMKGGNRKYSNIYAFNIKTGQQLWDFELKAEKKFGYAKFLVELCGNLFFYFNHDESIHAVNIENGQLVNKWKFASQPIFYDNKIGSLGEKHEELDLKAMKFTTTDMSSEYEKHLKRPWWIGHHNHISHGLGFVIFRRGYNVSKGEPEELILVAVDISTHKVVWQHVLTESNWKQLEYDGKRIYLLGDNGTLTIFEKEN